MLTSQAMSILFQNFVESKTPNGPDNLQILQHIVGLTFSKLQTIRFKRKSKYIFTKINPLNLSYSAVQHVYWGNLVPLPKAVLVEDDRMKGITDDSVCMVRLLLFLSNEKASTNIIVPYIDTSEGPNTIISKFV